MKKVNDKRKKSNRPGVTAVKVDWRGVESIDSVHGSEVCRR